MFAVSANTYPFSLPVFKREREAGWIYWDNMVCCYIQSNNVTFLKYIKIPTNVVLDSSASL